MIRKIFLPDILTALIIILFSSNNLLAYRASYMAKVSELFREANRRNDLIMLTSQPDSPHGAAVNSLKTQDIYLNFVKGQKPGREIVPEKYLNLADFEKLKKQVPQKIGIRNHADFAYLFAGMGEGNVFGVVGYVYDVFTLKGNQCSVPHGHDEHCEGEEIYGVIIGFNSSVASRLRTGKHGLSDSVIAKTVIAEINPAHIDSGTVKWNFELLNGIIGSPVKIHGQLIYDNVDASLSGYSNMEMPHNLPGRNIFWELSPVTEFYICKSSVPPTVFSEEWQALEDIYYEKDKQ